MDGDNKKPNRGRELQPYVPKGNGGKSGQYTSSTTCSYFCVREGCTKEDLKRLLTEEEIEIINEYTNFKIGCAINKRIREGAMTDDDVLFIGKIKSAANKYELKNDLIVYRGISVPKNIYLAKFLSNYERESSIHGSVICSTSRNIHRAMAAGKANPTCINLIFCFKLQKGYKALPIEDISEDPMEEEVILFMPKYKIKEINNIDIKGIRFKMLTVKLEKLEYENEYR